MQTATLTTVNVACAGCFTENRIPAQRLAEEPKCGRCGAPLLPGKPAVLGEASFDAYVGRTGLPVLVDFWAPWCGPCRAMAPHFEKAAEELRLRARLAKVDTEEAPGLAARMNIRAIPTLVLFKDGHEVARASGAMDARSLAKWVAQHA